MTDTTQSTSAPEDMPSPGTGGAHMSFREILQEAQGDLETTAREISTDQFSDDGIGAMGNLYRRVMDLTDPGHQEEAWSDLLQLSQKLWDSGELETSRKFLTDLQLRAHVPDIFVERIKDSIAYADDYMTYLKVREKFEAGEDDAARGLVSQISDANRSMMQDALEESIRDRRRSRRRVFMIAGGTGALLAGLVGFALVFTSDFLRDPPLPQRPAFDMPGDLSLDLPETDSVDQGAPDVAADRDPSGESSPPAVTPPSVRDSSQDTGNTQPALDAPDDADTDPGADTILGPAPEPRPAEEASPADTTEPASPPSSPAPAESGTPDADTILGVPPDLSDGENVSSADPANEQDLTGSPGRETSDNVTGIFSETSGAVDQEPADVADAQDSAAPSETDPVEEQPRDADPLDGIDPDLASNCAIARRVGARAMELARQVASDDAVARAEEFQKVSTDACGSLALPDSVLDEIASDIPQSRIDEMAIRIASGNG